MSEERKWTLTLAGDPAETGPCEVVLDDVLLDGSERVLCAIYEGRGSYLVAINPFLSVNKSSEDGLTSRVTMWRPVKESEVFEDVPALPEVKAPVIKIEPRASGTPLEQIMYCCECMRVDHNARNFGDAEGWIRHIVKALDDYDDELEESLESP